MLSKRFLSRSIGRLTAFAVIAFGIVFLVGSSAQANNENQVFLPAISVGKYEPPSKVAYIIQDRVQRIEEALQGLEGGQELPPEVVAELSDNLILVDENSQVLLEFHSAQEVGEQERADLEALGADVEISTADLVWPEGIQAPSGLGVIVAWIPHDQIEQAAGLPWVVAVTTVEYGEPDVGTFTSEGVALHDADDVHVSGIDGAGITIGAISDGVSTLATSQALGDLPVPVTVPGPCPASAGDEGTAMLEIIHDMAPGAALLFCPTGGGVVNHVAAQNNLFAAGANVIAEDIAFDSEPAFQKGLAAVNGDAIATAGVSMHSSAGNRGAQHAARALATGTGTGPDGVAGPFAGCPFQPDNVVAIAPGGDTTFDITVQPQTTGTTLSLTLQWSEPRAIFPTAGAGGFTDLNLYLMDAALTQCLGSSANGQGPAGAGDTIEQISIPFPAGPNVPVKIVVDVQSTGQAQAVPTIDLRWRGRAANTDNPTRAGSLNPDSNYTGPATASAAANAGPGGTTDPTAINLEGFSSGGPVQLFSSTVCPSGTYPCAGNAVAGGPGTTRGAPDWTAADGVSVSGVGGFGTVNIVCPAVSQGDCLFFGTSASTPHAAACDALVRQKIGGSPPVFQINGLLANSAVDRGAVAFDNNWGAGVLDCFSAIREEASSDLVLTKSDSPDPVISGESLTYVLEVTNNGPSPASNVVIQDSLPVGVTIDSVSASTGTCNAGVPGNASLPTTCSLGTLAIGAVETMTIEVTVLPGTDGILHNDAVVSSASLDPDNSNNLASSNTDVNAEVDLLVTKGDNPDPVIAGSELTYEITITNNGPSTAKDVALLDTLPDDTSYIGATVSNGSGTCVELQVPPNTVSCDLNDLDPGAFVKVFIQVLVDASVPDGTDIFNTADVSSAATELNAADNSSTETTTVNTSADLEILKEGIVDTTNPSLTVVYTIDVINNGTSDAQGVVVTDTLPLDPKKVEYVFDTGDGACVYDETTHLVTCDFGTLPNGDSLSFKIYVRIKGSVGEITNIAEVATTTSDPDSENDVARKDLLIHGLP